MKKHYICIDNMENGSYYTYGIDTFDYLLNDNEWAFINDAIDEQEYIINALDYMIESDDGEYVSIPTYLTKCKLDEQYMI